jgi:NADH-quinone oxidoreductase subunit C
MIEKKELQDLLSSIKEFSEFQITDVSGTPCLEIPKEKLIKTADIIKNNIGFDMLIDIVGVDRFTKENRFELIYNLWSTTKKIRMFLRVKLDSKKPEVETISSVWKTANWQEREVFDLFGITFLNHPDLRRIYMMDEYQHFPLRKDFPLMGIPNSIDLPSK